MGTIAKLSNFDSAGVNMPVIAGIEITTDDAGRFNLNALHKASGLGANKAPAQWLRTQSAKDLVSEITDMQICTSPIHASKGGVEQGTFAHELLAISYAGWISPAFQLQVNQVFLDYRTGKLAPVTPQLTTMEILQLAMQSEQERLRLAAVNLELVKQVEDAKPVIAAFGRIAVADGSMSITEAAKALQIQPKKLFILLSQEQWIYKRAGGQAWLGYQAKIQQGLVEHKVTTVERSDGSEKTVEQVRITSKGLTKLAQFLSVGGVQ